MTSPKFDTSKWTDTINALLANAADPRHSLEAQQAYAAKAAALMTKFGITDAQLHAARTTGTVADEEADLWAYAVANTHGLGQARADVIQRVALAMGCKTASQANRPPHPVVVAIVGTPADLDALRTLAPLIARQAELATMAAAAAGRRDTLYLQSFLHGYGTAVADRITARRRDFISETSGAELVLANRARIIEAHLDQLLGAYLGGARRTERIDSAGAAAGRNAGHRADLGDTQVGPIGPIGPRPITN